MTGALMSNVAAAAVLVPIGLESAELMQISPRALVISTAFGASLSFLSPIGYQTNTLVYGPGGYRFSDFLKVGAPLTLVCALAVSLLVPLFWPL